MVNAHKWGGVSTSLIWTAYCVSVSSCPARAQRNDRYEPSASGNASFSAAAISSPTCQWVSWGRGDVLNTPFCWMLESYHRAQRLHKTLAIQVVSVLDAFVWIKSRFLNINCSHCERIVTQDGCAHTANMVPAVRRTKKRRKKRTIVTIAPIHGCY